MEAMMATKGKPIKKKPKKGSAGYSYPGVHQQTHDPNAGKSSSGKGK
jgi:hypothetical protein